MGYVPRKNCRHREACPRLKARSVQSQVIPPTRQCAGNGASVPPVIADLSETLSGTVYICTSNCPLGGLGFFVCMKNDTINGNL